MTAPAGAPERWRLGHRPALDGLRGVGVLMVLLGHAGLTGPFRHLHVLGVEVFFVLSGFLITALLLEEHHRRGRIDLVAFYRRRARRLLPALVVFVAGVGLLSALSGMWDPSAVARGQLAGLFYAANLARVHHLDLGPLEHLWSLAVEEHFYIVLPALLGLLLGAGRVWRLTVVAAVAGAGIVASAVLRARWSGDWERVYNGSDTRAGSLLVGCLLAVALHAGWHHRVRLPVRGRRALVGTAPLALLAIAAFDGGQSGLFNVALPLAAATSAVLVAAASLSQGRTTALLSARPLRWAGELSYGLYLWHLPVYMLLGGRADASLPLPLAPAGMALSLGLAMASMLFVEARFTGRKPSVVAAWESRRRAPAATPAPAT